MLRELSSRVIEHVAVGKAFLGKASLERSRAGVELLSYRFQGAPRTGQSSKSAARTRPFIEDCSLQPARRCSRAGATDAQSYQEAVLRQRIARAGQNQDGLRHDHG